MSVQDIVRVARFKLTECNRVSDIGVESQVASFIENRSRDQFPLRLVDRLKYSFGDLLQALVSMRLFAIKVLIFNRLKGGHMEYFVMTDSGRQRITVGCTFVDIGRLVTWRAYG